MLWDASGNNQPRPGSHPAIKLKNNQKHRHHAATWLLLVPFEHPPHQYFLGRITPRGNPPWLPLPAPSPAPSPAPTPAPSPAPSPAPRSQLRGQPWLPHTSYKCIKNSYAFVINIHSSIYFSNFSAGIKPQIKNKKKHPLVARLGQSPSN